MHALNYVIILLLCVFFQLIPVIESPSTVQVGKRLLVVIDITE